MEYVARFLVGGLAVSAFAVLGDMLRPKGFAGLFSAAPSVALATLGIALLQQGASYAVTQGEAMMLGAVALCVYSNVVCQLLMRSRWRPARSRFTQKSGNLPALVFAISDRRAGSSD